jgi:hypothetical protein
MIAWSQIILEELASYVSEELKKRGIKTILVGGACATIYSKNRYQSSDLDFITYEEMKNVTLALKELGFKVKNRYFIHDECPWFIEFVSPPVAIGNEPIEKFEERKSKFGIIRMLLPTDSVKDRLAGFFHWDDRQGLEQAIDICLETEVDFKEIERWAIQEKSLNKYKEFVKKLAVLKNL